jgi:predicted GIY-YIG superfamily endonuclease
MDYEYVYLLKSEIGDHHYVGRTHDLKPRLAEHNRGNVPHTQKFAPWKIIAATAFADKGKAIAFEQYLKSHSGRAFARRHF